MPHRDLDHFRFMTITRIVPLLRVVMCGMFLLRRYLFTRCLFTGWLFISCLFTSCLFTSCLFVGCLFTGCLFTGCLFTGCLFRCCAQLRKRVRRQGKPLVSKPFVEGSDARNQQFRCQLKREASLRSTSNAVCQASVGGNLECRP